MKTIASDLLRFQEEETSNDTAVVTVLTKSAKNPLALGTIRWYAPFRSFVFEPAADSRFAYRVLADITSQVIAMMDEWAKAAGRKPTHGKSSPYKPRQKRCMALKPGGSTAYAPSCGRWLGHDGPHRQMGSTETWEG